MTIQNLHVVVKEKIYGWETSSAVSARPRADRLPNFLFGNEYRSEDEVRNVLTAYLNQNLFFCERYCKIARKSSKMFSISIFIIFDHWFLDIELLLCNCWIKFKNFLQCWREPLHRLLIKNKILGFQSWPDQKNLRRFFKVSDTGIFS